MGDQDLFSVAAAGGRSGEDFEQRAIDYRDTTATTSVTKVNAVVSSHAGHRVLYDADVPGIDVVAPHTSYTQ